jgi:lipopolysaccharide/colanic/teichoic acid biosynthesis glycosyltransferase
MKRLFDLIVSAVGLIILSPVFLVVALLVKADSPGPVFFKQRRVGRAFRPFVIYKFRTMRQTGDGEGALITAGRDPRITKVGEILRLTKIDELPQLINVFKGNMSVVGPRPEVPHYVELFRNQYEEILKVRPGITDLASLKYRDEAAFLGQFSNPEQEYIARVLPDKITLAKQYIEHASVLFDVRVIFKTLLKMFDHDTQRKRTAR